jgi:hypothetical protein
LRLETLVREFGAIAGYRQLSGHKYQATGACGMAIVPSRGRQSVRLTVHDFTSH